MTLQEELINLGKDAKRADNIRVSELIDKQYDKIIKKLKQAAKLGKDEININLISGCTRERFYIKDEIKKSIKNKLRKENLVVSNIRSYNYNVTIRW